MSNIGSELGNLGAASAAQAQQFHNAAMAAGAEHLRAANDARPIHETRWRRAALFVPLIVVGAAIAVLLVV